MRTAATPGGEILAPLPKRIIVRDFCNREVLRVSVLGGQTEENIPVTVHVGSEGSGPCHMGVNFLPHQARELAAALILMAEHVEAANADQK